MPRTAYRKLEERFARLSRMEGALAFLHWDMAVVMPPGGALSRGEELATLKGLHHALQTAPEVADWLDEAEGEPGTLDDWQAANLREMRRAWVHAAALPAALVEARARACAACETVWREAKARADFAMVAPKLAEVLRITREVGAAKAERLGRTPYDALLDEYEPDGRAEEIDRLFAELEAVLPDLIVRARAKATAAPRPCGPFPRDAMRKLSERLMEALGFDFRHGRLDESLHPFSGGTPDDVRITTRFDEDDFSEGLMAVLHETGHALYERGLPARWRHQPVGLARGMSIHESQSLLVEMQACRSPEFFAFAAPLLREAFAADGPAWTPEALYANAVRVEPGCIRVEADEVTYPAHVLLRTRLERALVAGEMEVGDLPAAWNEGMERLLGVTPPDDAKGCLQDIHWYDGAWGYFPTYTLGAMTAAQLFQAACAAVDGIRPAIATGDFRPLMDWLRETIHAQGSRYSTRELLARATGRPLETAPFLDHLRTRYLGE